MSEKRPAEEREEPNRKYVRYRLASPSPERSGGSDTESIHSCQGYETELAKDTSDTSSSPLHNIEFDVIDIDTDSDSKKKKFFLLDDSDEEDNHAEGNKIFSEVSCDSLDKALLADTSEENPTSPTSNSDVDPGLPRSDYLDFEKCLLCQTDEKDISYPYCTTCFTSKKDSFPNRPRKRKKIMKKDNTHTSDATKDSDKKFLEISKLERNCEGEVQLKNNNDSTENNTIDDSVIGSSKPQFSQDAESSQLKKAVKSQLSEGVIEGSQSAKDVVERPSKEYSPSSLSTPSTSTSNTQKLSLGMCRVCFSKPENGLFIHTNMAHLYGCYSCAKKIWFHNGGCPICRRKIFKIAKLFV